MRQRPPLRLSRIGVFLLLLATPVMAMASEGHGASADVWITLAAILLSAKLGGEVAVRLKQPAVLGELFMGIVLGNVHLALGGFVSPETLQHIQAAPTLHSVEFLAELGVVLLLFEVGLESTLVEMKKVAPQSGLVAIIGVVLPIGLGFAVSKWLMPADSPTALHLFVGATLCATSVGITARVLKDLGAMGRDETKIILGAAVIDDVLGLLVLAVVSAIAASATGALPPMADIGVIVGKAGGFLIGALLLGTFIMPGVFKFASKLRTPGVLAALSIGLCLLLSGAAAAVGLAAIIGAFAAGLILDEVHVKPFGKVHSHDLSVYVSPIVSVMAPIFFVRTGMMVDLSGVGLDPLLLAGAMSVVAILSKLAAGLGVRGTADKLSVGIGMVPRGEVGLIFADAGARIVNDGHPLIEAGPYMAIVLMVMITTMVTPPWLASRLRKTEGRAGGGSDPGSDAHGDADGHSSDHGDGHADDHGDEHAADH